MSTENGRRVLMEDTFMIKFPAKAWGAASTRSELTDADSSTRTSGT